MYLSKNIGLFICYSRILFLYVSLDGTYLVDLGPDYSRTFALPHVTELAPGEYKLQPMAFDARGVHSFAVSAGAMYFISGRETERVDMMQTSHRVPAPREAGALYCQHSVAACISLLLRDMRNIYHPSIRIHVAPNMYYFQCIDNYTEFIISSSDVSGEFTAGESRNIPMFAFRAVLSHLERYFENTGGGPAACRLGINPRGISIDVDSYCTFEVASILEPRAAIEQMSDDNRHRRTCMSCLHPQTASGEDCT